MYKWKYLKKHVIYPANTLLAINQQHTLPVSWCENGDTQTSQQ